MTNKNPPHFQIPPGSAVSPKDYEAFLNAALTLFREHNLYLSPAEGIDALELAHLYPWVPETMVALYVSINDAVCNKGIVSPFLVRHGHNNVFVFDPQVYSGGADVPSGTLDARKILSGFSPPNSSWPSDWTYVIIADPNRSYTSLWQEKGYIDTIPAKFEDFTLLTNPQVSRLCVFVDPKAFNHPVNQARPYLLDARRRGQASACEFTIPKTMEDEVQGLEPLILLQGEKLYIASDDFTPCPHAWSNLHPANKQWAVVNENSAVPLDLVIAKPKIKEPYARFLRPPAGSADMTTDWFYRGQLAWRSPVKQGSVKG